MRQCDVICALSWQYSVIVLHEVNGFISMSPLYVPFLHLRFANTCLDSTELAHRVSLSEGDSESHKGYLIRNIRRLKSKLTANRNRSVGTCRASQCLCTV